MSPEGRSRESTHTDRDGGKRLVGIAIATAGAQVPPGCDGVSARLYLASNWVTLRYKVNV
jgi:hypothetical protein